MFGKLTSRLLVRLTLLACFLSLTVAAYAGNNVNVTLTGAGGAQYGLGNNYEYGEYVMPYYLTINNSAPIAVICDDYNHTVNIGDQWTAAISTFSNLSGTRFGTADSTQYHEAAWIASQITATSTLDTIAAAQFAIWKLFASNTPTVPGMQTWLTAAAAAASANYYGMDFSHWEILTPQSPASPQEYFFYVPEPSVLLDLLMGLVAFAGIWSVKRRRMASASVVL